MLTLCIFPVRLLGTFICFKGLCIPLGMKSSGTVVLRGLLQPGPGLLPQFPSASLRGRTLPTLLEILSVLVCTHGDGVVLYISFNAHSRSQSNLC